MKTITIGRHSSNDYQLSDHELLSRHHATLTRNRDGSYTITDSSTNGTFVSGEMIKGQSRRVQREDIIRFADVETLDWSRIPSKSRRPVIWLLGVLAVGLIAVVAYNFITRNSCPKTVTEIVANNEDKVGVVVNAFIYRTTLCDGVTQVYLGIDRDLYEDTGDKKIVPSLSIDQLHPYLSFGTGFVAEQNDVNYIVTNRHVANPAWSVNQNEYSTPLEAQTFSDFKRVIDQYEADLGLPSCPHRTYDIFSKKLVFIPSGSGIAINKSTSELLFLSDLGPTNLTLHCYSTQDDIDLALLKPMSKNEYTERTIDLDESVNSDLADINPGDQTTLIGYSGGIGPSFSETLQEINYLQQSGTIQKQADPFNISYNINTDHGSSGSPVFDECGKLIAVHYAGSTTSGYGIPIRHVYQLIEFNNCEK